MKKSFLIIINGTSCAGKTSAAKYIQQELPNDFSYLSWDEFRENLQFDPSLNDEDKKDLVAAFNRKACEIMDSEKNLILDIVCVPGKTFERLLRAFSAYELLTVRMRASVETLNARERVRENRENGQAEEQHMQMYFDEKHPAYDLEIDSTHNTTAEIGQTIIKKLQSKKLSPAIPDQPLPSLL